MQAAAFIHFPPFHLDLANEQLWQGTEPIPLRPKPFAILRYLVENPGRLVTKEELLKAVWSETYVSEGLLHTYIRDLRSVLEDNPEAPRFIETVVRRGYRFIAPLTPASPVASLPFHVPSSAPQPSGLSTQHSVLVGREPELAQLHGWLEKARSGERQVVFVTGEPGIGKTTLVDAFLHQAVTSGGLWIGRGQCIEHYGAGEAYLPLLKAFGRLCRESGGERLIALLNRHAPTWLAQMPALLSDPDLEALQRKVQGATRDRMLREFAELVEAVSTEQPLVLALEDLHWSDPSTLDLLTLVAQRREAARVLVLGTYRPADVIVRDHPLRAIKQELYAHRQCEELTLGFLSEAAVAEYLAVRFPGSELPAELARLIYRRTEGNPLFMVTVVDDLVAQGLLREVRGQWQLQAALEEVTVGIPDSLRQLIERQLERLSREEQRVLEVASIAGTSFSALTVAAGGEESIEQVEAHCERLVRRGQFLHASGTETVPDGTLTGRYGFLHTLYQSVVYERVGAIQRIRLHRRIGERLEEAYGTRAKEVAAELAVHFEQGQDYRRAIQYLERAAWNALQRSAYVEATSHLSKGLELLKAVPETVERLHQELKLQIPLGLAFMATKSYSAPEVGHAYSRARELCQQLGATAELAQVLSGLWAFHGTRAELPMAYEAAEQLLRLGQHTQDPALIMEGHFVLGLTSYFMGKFASAREHLEQSLTFYNPKSTGSRRIEDLSVACPSMTAMTLWYLGYQDQALKTMHEARARAHELSHPFSLAYALVCATQVHILRREIQTVQEEAAALIAFSIEQGFPFRVAQGTILRGWALAMQGQEEEGIAQLRQGIAAYRATGAEVEQSNWLGLLAAAYRKAGRAKEGLSALVEALETVSRGELRWYEAELYRLKGELTLAQSSVRGLASSVTMSSKLKARRMGTAYQNVSINEAGTVGGAHPTREAEAEECFWQAIEIARKQRAKSLELRAVMSLARLWQQQGKKKKARRMLAEIYGWFIEGFDTADLREAKALLEQLNH